MTPYVCARCTYRLVYLIANEPYGNVNKDKNKQSECNRERDDVYMQTRAHKFICLTVGGVKVDPAVRDETTEPPPLHEGGPANPSPPLRGRATRQKPTGDCLPPNRARETQSRAPPPNGCPGGRPFKPGRTHRQTVRRPTDHHGSLSRRQSPARVLRFGFSPSTALAFLCAAFLASTSS